MTGTAPGSGPLPGEVLDGLEGPRLVVAVSGGLDSMVLLHRLRFGPGVSRELHVAHLDHGMRPGSAADAVWLQGVTRAWRIPLTRGRLPDPPRSEADARDARYAFLHRVADEVGAPRVAVAHHADDQAETVLFRVLRGTGVRGLEGMRSPEGRVVRPFLRVWRRELERYARRWRVPYRVDGTNRDPAFARNVLRHDVIPAAEAGVAAGARSALVRLAENARDVRAELADHRERLLATFRLPDREDSGSGRVELRAEGLDALAPVLRRQLVRDAALRVGVRLSRRASVLAGDALAELRPGQGLDLSGGLRLERGRDRWTVLAPEVAEARRQRRREAAGGAESGPVASPASRAGAPGMRSGPEPG